MMKRLLAVMVLTAVMAVHGEWKIVCPTSAPLAERTAAAELQAELSQLFGVTLPLVSEAPSPAIRVGTDAANAQRLGVDFTALKTDEIILKTVGEDLILAGAAPRGTLYAVYEYLERYLGVRFWAPGETFYPKKDGFALPVANYRYAPPLLFREAFYDLVSRNKPFASRMRNNWHFSRLPEEYGGNEQIIGWCHTFDQFMPAKEHFKAHPEYYAMRDGKRVANAQPCLTNKAYRKALAESALKQLAVSRSKSCISISQNDNQFYCTCPECEAFVKAHGNQTDLLLDAVNDVADAIGKVYPQTRVTTLAYQYTRELPRTIRPHDNVVIHLCSIECDYSKPIAEGLNESFGKQVLGWSKLAKELFIWNYVTNFRAFYLPHPNWKNLGGDLRFFVQNHVTGVFEQGSSGPHFAGDLTPLRAYLISKLLWNPQLDDLALREEFISGYYGALAPYVREYIDLMIAEVEAHPQPKGLVCFDTEANWLSNDGVIKAADIARRAEEAAHGNAALERKAAQAFSSVKFVLLDRRLLGKTWMAGMKPMAVVDSLVKIWKDAGSYLLAEGDLTPDNLRYSYAVNYSAIQEGERPPMVKEGGEWCGVALFKSATLHGRDRWAFRVDDPKATFGRAVMMPTDHYQWATQLTKFPNGCDYDVYLACRCDSTAGDIEVLTMGFYQKTGNDHPRVIRSSEIAGEDYTLVHYGELKAGATGILYMAPVLGENGPKVYLDRMVFVKK